MTTGERIINFLVWLFVVVILALVFVFGGCGKGTDVEVKAEKWEVFPGESIRLIADTRNMQDGYYARYYWTILTYDCGRLSSTTSKSVYWTAPTRGPFPRECVIQVEVITSYSGSGDKIDDQEFITVEFAIRVNPAPVTNRAPQILRFIVPVQSVAPGDIVSFYVEAIDPEGGTLRYDWRVVPSYCGTIKGSGAGVTWTVSTLVPLPSSCSVNVAVIDLQGAASGVSAEFIILN